MLSADVITRYLRLLDEDVISVTGSDAHGTPILIAALQSRQTPEAFVTQKHEEFVELLSDWNIEFDNYTVTTTENHKLFVQDFYKDLFDNGLVEEKSSEQFFCQSCSRFLPDRFVIGICPKCNTDQARGDQCSNDDCNIPLTPDDIIEPKCAQCGLSPTRNVTTHWYFKLENFQDYLIEFLTTRVNIPENFRNEALEFVKRGLENRALTRDLVFGIPASPVFGSKANKVFYVWAEDVLGYISATIPVYNNQKRNWKEIWKDVNSVYCVGKDNLFYHAIWFPALVQASSNSYSEPTDISITNFLQFDGQGFSKSKGIGIWADEALQLAPADYWRFYLIFNRPDKKDGNFTFNDFEDTLNKYLANTIGNIIVRVVSLIHKFESGLIIQQFPRLDTSKQVLTSIGKIDVSIVNSIYKLDIRESLNKTIEIAKQVNQYLVDTSPWNIKDSKIRQEILYIAYWGLARLSIWLSPVIPNLSSEIKSQLNIEGINLRNSGFKEFKPPKSIPNRDFFVKKLDLGTLLSNNFKSEPNLSSVK